MGAGKTTIGRLLAEKLDWAFVDLDEAFAEINSLTTAQYIRRYGLEAFRHKEKACVEDLSELPIQKVIYATGGGYPCWEDNMDCLHELGTSIYLRWSNEHLTERLWLTDLEERPVIEAKTKDELRAFVTWQMEAREPFYSQADFILEASQKVGTTLQPTDDERLAQELYQLIQQML